MLNRNHDISPPCLLPDFNGNASGVSISIMLAVVLFFVINFYNVRKFPYIQSSVKVLKLINTDCCQIQIC